MEEIVEKTEMEKWMKVALDLAKRGIGWVNPNPLVGAVIVKNGQLIAQGWHEKCGDPHAERNAIGAAIAEGSLGELDGATMYVNLEPCCHHGRTPPCTEVILECGLAKVVVGNLDPNPRVAGNGVKELRARGVEVVVGILEAECKELNEVFFHYIQTGRPYVVMKYAMTADGKIATSTGDSKWITGEDARAHVHQLRHSLSGIMVGINTVLKDDPMLTCRLSGADDAGREHHLLEEQLSQPVRIICDSHLKIPLDSKLVKTAKEIPVIVACVMDENESFRAKLQQLIFLGVQVLPVSPDENGRVDIGALMKELGNLEIDSIILEGGADLNFSALEKGVVNKVMCYVAPKIIGGKGAKTPVAGKGVMLIEDHFSIKLRGITTFHQDILLEYEIHQKEGEEKCLPG